MAAVGHLPLGTVFEKEGILIILGHGVTGNKIGPFSQNLPAGMRTGLIPPVFICGNGDSEGDFREATISKESEDLDAVISSAANIYSNIVYIGHSMGGAVGLNRASQDVRISALVSQQAWSIRTHL